MTPPEAPSNKIRLQFDFSKRSLDKLDELVETLGADTRAEIITRALTVYTELLGAQERGNKLILRDPAGEEKELLLF